MQLDGGGTESSPSSDLADYSSDDLIRPRGGQAAQAEEVSPAVGREGLPKRFRMRHARHYVDELLGDAPLRTVREIAISEIDPPPDADLDPPELDRLEASIRRLGVIEPLLVGRRGSQYRVIAGMRRLRAARTVGLNTVPCLVHDVDDEKFTDMRNAAAQRLAPVVAPPLEAARTPDAASETPEVSETRTIGSDASAVSLDPVDERLRSIVLDDLASVQRMRQRIASASADFLSRTTPAIEVAPASTTALVNDAISAISLEARLRAVRIDVVSVIGQHPDYRMSIDAERCRTALIGLLQCLLSLSKGAGAMLEVRSQVTTMRPALIIDCRLLGGDTTPLGDDAIARFFDPEWTDHPCGSAGAVVLGAVARTARAHGGRVQIHRDGTVTFVVPRPLRD